MCVPDSVEEHLVAGLTRNTACGEQYTTKTSSGVNDCDGCDSTSSCIDFEITIRVGAPGAAVGSVGSAIWNANGTGSSS